MTWPWMSRKDHAAIVLQMAVNMDLRDRLIKALEETLTQQHARLVYLEMCIENKAISAAMPLKSGANGPDLVTGRGGWRAKAQAASEATMPKPPDSVQALEDRVMKQGGSK